MNQNAFVDYYELLELNPKAHCATIERVFRYLARKHHPDASPSNDPALFAKFEQAYDTLKDPKSRAAYDAEYGRQKSEKVEIVAGANAAGEDCVQRYKLLSILYAQRRRDFKKPGIGIGTLEQLVDFPAAMLEFHLWYFRQKDWVAREEGGQLAITAAGVDQIETINRDRVADQLAQEQQPETMPQREPQLA